MNTPLIVTAVAACGGKSATARLCQTTRQNVQFWCKRGGIPDATHRRKVARKAKIKAALLK